MTLSGQVFREARGRRTLRFGCGQSNWFLKTHSGVGWQEIFKNLLYLRLPVVGADNEWHALHALRRKGIDTPRPLGFGRKGSNPARRVSFVVTAEVEDSTSLEELIDINGGCVDDLSLKRALIPGVANIARTLHRGGANHRDFYLCHFLINNQYLDPEKRIETSLRITLIDLHRAQLRRKTPVRWIIKDLAGLYYSSLNADLTRNDLYRFAKAYSGLPLRGALRAMDWDRVKRRAARLHRSEQASVD